MTASVKILIQDDSIRQENVHKNISFRTEKYKFFHVPCIFMSIFLNVSGDVFMLSIQSATNQLLKRFYF